MANLTAPKCRSWPQAASLVRHVVADLERKDHDERTASTATTGQFPIAKKPFDCVAHELREIIASVFGAGPGATRTCKTLDP